MALTCGHQSRRADSNREPPDYKIQDRGVGEIWMMLPFGYIRRSAAYLPPIAFRPGPPCAGRFWPISESRVRATAPTTV
jgi:hypothetical protein